MSIADCYPVGLSGCDRNGIAGNCSTENCDTLMAGECEMMDDFDQQWLHDLGLIDEVIIVPQIGVFKPKKVHDEEAYDRAMEIL